MKGSDAEGLVVGSSDESAIMAVEQMSPVVRHSLIQPEMGRFYERRKIVRGIHMRQGESRCSLH